MNTPQYPFYRKLARIVNSGQANAVLVYGNINDLYFCNDKFVPLHQFLSEKFDVPGVNRILYQQNRPIDFFGLLPKIKIIWVQWRLGMTNNGLISNIDEIKERFEEVLKESVTNSNVALELLRQIGMCWRETEQKGRLLVIIDDADLIIPAGDGDISRLNEVDRRSISIVQDWLSDSTFLGSTGAVIIIAEGISQIHPKVTRLPHLATIEVGNPTLEDRRFFVELFHQNKTEDSTRDQEARQTAGLSILALRQLLLDNVYDGNLTLKPSVVITKVEEYIKGQIGADVVEFFRPTHTLDDVVGATALKKFLVEKFIPRCQQGKNGSLSGATVAGPIGGGKTFIMSAVAGALGIPVLVLKNIRSQWFGQTDVIFERLRRVLESLDVVMIFVDEADTQGFGVGKDVHETERRLAGKMQAMMSDPALRGKVIWLLMTARPELLSPDIRRPGRAGDLIIPVLDPEGDDRKEFLRWLVKPFKPELTNEEYEVIAAATANFSPATFASIRAEAVSSGVTSWDELHGIIIDTLESDIGSSRQYQTLQAMLNCTKMSLLPKDYQNPDTILSSRNDWRQSIQELKRKGYAS